ncbi:MAG: biotin--[acetyl-CoA-carboxylase] ligase [Sedimentisphaerales bacterium]|nr:biotin--[acetyl-CoA-carboxylase] ligase [Sedimentisphaerales bacterium]
MKPESEVLRLLREHGSGWVSMEVLQSAAEVSSEQIGQIVEKLREIGYEIESAAMKGFGLRGVNKEGLSSELISYGLATERIGQKVLVYEATDSTNDVAWCHAGEEGFDGLAVFAEQQRRGRGRLGRSWLAGRCSSVLCSVLLQNLAPMPREGLALLAGLAAAEAIESCCGGRVRIKWPNDVTFEGLKVAGTIVESRRTGTRDGFVIGLGINCSQRKEDFSPELRESATSLWLMCGSEVDRVQLAQELLCRLEDWLKAVSAEGGLDQPNRRAEAARPTNLERLHQSWLGRCDELGRRIRLVCNNQTFEGRVIDVCPEKGLLLQLDAGAVRVFDAATTIVDRNYGDS